MLFRPLSIVVLGFSVTVPALSQDQCNSILSLGFKNIYKRYGNDNSTSAKYSSYCGTKASDVSSDLMASAEVEVLGSGGGGAKLTRAESEKRLEQWCNVNKESSGRVIDNKVDSEEINKDSVTAWSSCKRLFTEGLSIEPRITDDVVDLRVRYPGVGTGGIQFYGVEARNFQCEITLPGQTKVPAAKLTGKVVAGSQAIAVYCVRQPPVTKNGLPTDATVYQVREKASITVLSAASVPYTLAFTEEWTPDVPGRESTLLRGELAKANAALAAHIKATAAEVASLKQSAANLGNDVTALKSGLAAEQTPGRVILARTEKGCPAGWKNRTATALRIENTQFAANNLAPGGGQVVNEPGMGGWVYTYPLMCER